MARISKYDRTSENDIRYKGPLSYRHLMIFGWACICLMILGRITTLGVKINPNQPQWYLVLDKICNTLGGFSLPLFLLANFAIILDKKKTYKQQLIKFGGLSLLIVVLFVIVKEFYLVGFVNAFLENRAESNELILELLNEAAVNGSLIFNLFIDLFLCTLFMFFLEYTPKKSFQGKIGLFRALAVLPVLYEVGALVLRMAMVFGKLKPPYIVYPLLTTKPFFSFILFVILALHIKWEDRRFRKRGKTPEELDAFFQTNDHSLRFSIFTSIMILVTGALDLIAAVFGMGFVGYMNVGFNFNVELSDEVLDKAAVMVQAWKIGLHFPMVCLIPIVLLFSYTRNHKNSTPDKFIPIIGILAAVFFAFQGLAILLITNVVNIVNDLLPMLEQMVNK
jgi:hypothetical protein